MQVSLKTIKKKKINSSPIYVLAWRFDLNTELVWFYLLFRNCRAKTDPRTLCPQASLPVQDYLSMPFEKIQKQAEVARHLPPPLYVLFVQANAYSQACGESRQNEHDEQIRKKKDRVWRLMMFLFKNWSIFIRFSDKLLSVSISGDVDEARALSKPPDDSQGTWESIWIPLESVCIKIKTLDRILCPFCRIEFFLLLSFKELNFCS